MGQKWVKNTFFQISSQTTWGAQTGEMSPFLRRHKLPAPHLALWPTEVHVVVRRKVCEKGCYFGGIYPPLVAIGKMKVCM